MRYLKAFLGIFLVLAASRFIPHPPNFTSLIALSFYIPAFFGLIYIPLVILSFLITDIFIGFHNLTLFTWGSVLLIGLISKYFLNTIYLRIGGALLGAVIFFIITNFGVWIIGDYSLDFKGFIECYFLAIPFFGYTVISTIVFSFLIEIICFLLKQKKLINY
tara:strand:+ start:793 stop:1278 length:486 start_codon:yes stop_codon:yes gene_type:complete